MTLRRNLVGVAVLVALIGLMLIATTPAQGSHQSPESTAQAGVLRLHLDADGDYFRFDPVSGPSLQQDLSTPKNCTVSSNETLVALSAMGGSNSKVGAVDHETIGVKVNGEGNGRKCGQINNAGDQKLKLSLTGALAGKAIDSAEIDLGCKFDGEGNIELFHGGVSVDNVNVTFTGSDCGPDSGSADNERVIITGKIFDTLEISVLSPSNGAISLQGGRDNPDRGPIGMSLNTNDTLFNVVELFDGVIDCGDTQEVEGTSSDGIATFIRLNNADDPTVQCNDPKGVNFSAAVNEIEFNVQVGPTPLNGRFVGKIEFLPRLDSAGPLKLKYDPAGGTAFIDSLACDLSGPLPTDTNDGLTALGFDTSLLGGQDVSPDLLNDQTWCTVGSTSVTVGSGLVRDIYWVFGFGDPRWGGF